jgi:hypothetical protein
VSRTTKILRVCLVVAIIGLIVAVVAAIVGITGGRPISDFISPVLTTTVGTACVLIALNSAKSKDSDDK